MHITKIFLACGASFTTNKKEKHLRIQRLLPTSTASFTTNRKRNPSADSEAPPVEYSVIHHDQKRNPSSDSEAPRCSGRVLVAPLGEMALPKPPLGFGTQAKQLVVLAASSVACFSWIPPMRLPFLLPCAFLAVAAADAELKDFEHFGGSETPQDAPTWRDPSPKSSLSLNPVMPTLSFDSETEVRSMHPARQHASVTDDGVDAAPKNRSHFQTKEDYELYAAAISNAMQGEWDSILRQAQSVRAANGTCGYFSGIPCTCSTTRLGVELVCAVSFPRPFDGILGQFGVDVDIVL